MHRIVIVGGGAGGLELATRLGDWYRRLGKAANASVTLIDHSAAHVWKPLLHEVAAGSMDPSVQELSYAAQARWHAFEFEQGELCGLDRSKRRIMLSAVTDDDGNSLLPARAIAYDTLILAIGSVTHFFGVQGASANCVALDSVRDANAFHRQLIAASTRAWYGPGSDDSATSGQTQSSRGEREVRIVIVGGGATGVELSAELRQTAQALSVYGPHTPAPKSDIRITLVESGPRILPALSERISRKALHALERLDIQVLTGESVAKVDPGGVHMDSGRVVDADLTVWAAGIKAAPVTARLDGLAVNHLGQILVGPTLQTDEDPDIFALGDCAACPGKSPNQFVPPRAQAAHQQARFMVRAMKCRLAGTPLPHFTYRDQGSLVSLGRSDAAGNLAGGVIGGNVFIEGLYARLMYAALYRMHMSALHGFARTATTTLAQWLQHSTRPRIKLH